MSDRPFSQRFCNHLLGLSFACCALLLPLPGTAASLKDCDVGEFERVRDQTLRPLFNALRAGDLNRIRRHLSTNMAAEYAVLFDQNPQYGQFLRDYYAGSSYQVLDVEGQDRDFTAIVMIYWADGRTAEIELVLDKARGDVAAVVAPGAACP